MPILTPDLAADAASGIYDILTQSNLLSSFSSSLRDKFDFEKPLEFNGKSGFTLMQTTSGFGLAAMGKGVTYHHDALIVIRGTELSADWVTDAHAGTAVFCGNIVHSGFYKVFRSILPALHQFFQVHHPLRVHVVGHSLGGAVATLVAQWIKQNGKGEPYLYTFGSPRVGFSGFAHLCTANLQSRNIYRVFHENDPVPMVPISPFAHIPLPGRAYREFYQAAGSPINPQAHKMANYQATVAGKSWASLREPVMIALPDYVIEDWLSSSRTVAGHLAYDIVHYSRETVSYILRKYQLVQGMYYQSWFMNISNGLDVLASVIDAGKKVTEEVKNTVLRLVRKIHAALGLAVSRIMDVTGDLLRWTMQRLEEALFRMARTAVRGSLSV